MTIPLDATIDRVSAEIGERVRPVEVVLDRLATIPGVGRRIAGVPVAALGTDVGRPPTPGHRASWAGMCPGTHASAGKRQGGTTRQGNPAVRAALVEAAQAAGRTQDTSLAARYRWLTARRGKKQAAVAVGHTILVMVYHLLASQHRLALLPAGRRRDGLEAAFTRALDEALARRILPFDEPAGRHAGEVGARRQRGGHNVDLRDTQIAGIALARRATVATRNVRHFADLGVPVLNPWDGTVR